MLIVQIVIKLMHNKFSLSYLLLIIIKCVLQDVMLALLLFALVSILEFVFRWWRSGDRKGVLNILRDFKKVNDRYCKIISLKSISM